MSILASKIHKFIKQRNVTMLCHKIQNVNDWLQKNWISHVAFLFGHWPVTGLYFEHWLSKFYCAKFHELLLLDVQQDLVRELLRGWPKDPEPNWKILGLHLPPSLLASKMSNNQVLLFQPLYTQKYFCPAFMYLQWITVIFDCYVFK